MGLRDLFAANAALLRDPERFGEEVTYFDPVTTPATETTVTAIVEFIPQDGLVLGEEADEIMEQGTIDVPATLAINELGWFTRSNGEILKITGRGGRDAHLQTLTINHPINLVKKKARRKSY